MIAGSTCEATAYDIAHGVLGDEADIRRNKVAGCGNVVDVECFLAERNLETAVQLLAALRRRERHELAVVSRIERPVGRENDGIDHGATRLNAGKANSFAHPVRAHQRLEEQSVGDFGGTRAELADFQRLGEDIGQFGFSKGGGTDLPRVSEGYQVLRERA